ncbi:MAG: DUF5615 family PIN-like protein [Bauldia sp.]
MHLLVDAQLPTGLVSLLRHAGHQAAHVSAIGLLSATDREIWSYAVNAGFDVIITKDEDFAVMRRRATEGPKVVWVRFGNTTNTALTQRLQPLLQEILDAMAAGETLIEVR